MRLNACVVFIAALVVCSPSPVGASTIKWGDDIVKPLRFPKGDLNVFIKPDPKGQGRDALVKEGVERWKDTLAARGITLKVSIGDPPAGTENPIKYTWEDDGFKEGGRELGPGKDDALSGPDNVKEGDTSLTAGSAHLRNALPAAGDDQKNYLKNLAEHEMVHILGLSDDDNGSVTKHTQDSDPRGLNDTDKKEINGLYATANTGGNQTATALVNMVPIGPNTFQFGFTFLPGNAVFDPNDPEHVADINFRINPAIVQSFDLPPGWIAYVPSGIPSPLDSFFTEGYMLDVDSSLPPWDAAHPMSYVGLRASVAESQADGLPIGFDPALGPGNPFFIVTLHTNQPTYLAPISVYAGGDLQSVLGPVAVPEPATLVLAGAGLVWLLRLRRRRAS